MEHDVAFPSAHFADDHRPPMERAADTWGKAKVPHKVSRCSIKDCLDGGKTLNGSALPPAGRLRPRDDHLIADILVNLPMLVVDGVRCQREDAIEKLMHATRPKALGERGGPHDVDKEEESLFGAWPVIPA